MEPISKVDELTQWFGENGGHLNEEMEMLHNLEYGYHYVAKSRPVNLKETVCSCPSSLTLSHLNVIPASLTGIHDNPLWFNDEELAYLKGTNLLSNGVPREQTSIGFREGIYKEQWKLGIAELENASDPTEEFTWDLFLWAATIFSSRSFTSDLFTTSGNTNASFPILYPVLDIFNHRIGAKVGWQFDNGNFSLYLEENVEQSQQIFNNYSPKGNEDLLMGFGFCIPDNPYDQLVVRLGQVQPEIHRKLHDGIPSHWRSETWEPRESVFHLQNTSSHTDGSSSMYGVPKLNCLRGIPPELAKSVYIIILAHTEDAVFEEELANEKQIWASIIDLLLSKMEATLREITRWNGELADFHSG
ncbi:SET domain-containing protein [Mytilinidion resinicola]|uniref:SET domain-containing protein n=1 Tax=Mytilinidion resinicola TaxID=574789 RepID=A0A6A6Y811_9PEZI|nr:SET domain-containing protein [Mytilinidion resinicola]KAF2804952.1 SET domain-containing protein [Mytilinidion resinicola]